MNQTVDLDAQRRDGERLWRHIQEGNLLANFWNNPWYRFAAIAAVLVIAAIVTEFIWQNHYVSVVLGILALPCLFTAARYFWIGVQTGGLYSFFSESGFGIGCDADRLLIPYSAMQLPEMVSPATVNENYIVLPVRVDQAGIFKSGIVIEHKNGADLPWDGTPYKRGIATIQIKDGQLQVHAYPNEFIVHLFCVIYPLCLYLKSKDAIEAG